MDPGGRQSIRVQYYFIPILFEESLKNIIFFSNKLLQGKRNLNYIKCLVLLKITCGIQTTEGWCEFIFTNQCLLGTSGLEVLRGPSSEFHCNKAGLTSRSRVSVCCRQCHNMSLRTPSISGWASCGGSSVMATAASHQVHRFACEMQIFKWWQMGLGRRAPLIILYFHQLFCLQ